MGKKKKKDVIDKIMEQMDRITILKTIPEEWRDVYINGTKTDYIISSYGNIIDNNGDTVKLYTKDGGYTYAYLKNIKLVPSHIKIRSVHRLVAEAFIPNPENKPTVNHEDGNKQNNHWWNLKWNTYSENIKHAFDNGLNKTSSKHNRFPQGSEHYANVYTNDQIHDVCEMLGDPKITPTEIWKITGVPRDIISLIYKGKNWTHISSTYPSFPEREVKTRNKKIKELIDMGYSGRELNAIVFEMFDLPDRTTARGYVMRVRNKYKLESCSTTSQK